MAEYGDVSNLDAVVVGVDRLLKNVEEENERKSSLQQQHKKKTTFLRDDYSQALENLQIENKGIVKEFNREGEEKLGSFSGLLKKDNKDFFDALDNQEQALATEMSRIRRDVEIEQSERRDKL